MSFILNPNQLEYFSITFIALDCISLMALLTILYKSRKVNLDIYGSIIKNILISDVFF